LLHGLVAAGAAVVLALSPSVSTAERADTPTLHGFVRDRDGDFITIEPPGAGPVKVGGVNNRGDVVGIGYPSATDNAGGFGFVRDRRGHYTTFRVPGTALESRTVASDINDRGEIAGWSDDGRRSFGYIRARDGAFVRIEHPDAAGTVPIGLGDEIAGTDLRGINKHGDVVGNFVADGTIYGFVRDRHGTYTTIQPPGAAATVLTGINDQGDVAGTYSTLGSEDLLVGAPRSFVLSNGVYRDIAVPDAVGTAVNGIDNRGRVAGTYADSNGTFHGFVSMRDGGLETVDHPDAAGLDTAVYALNDRGELTGAYLSIGTAGASQCDNSRSAHRQCRLSAGSMFRRQLTCCEPERQSAPGHPRFCHVRSPGWALSADAGESARGPRDPVERR
jgi:hypothetical protein